MSLPFDSLARAAREAARAVLWQATPAAAVFSMGAVGSGLLIYSGFTALQTVVGSSLAALALGAGLIALALVGGEVARRMSEARPSTPLAVAPDRPVEPAPPSISDGADDVLTQVVFAAAYVLGRRLRDRDDAP